MIIEVEIAHMRCWQGGAREVSREWEGAGVPRARRGERNDGLQKLSWSNHTEPRQKAPHRMDQRQVGTRQSPQY